MALLFADLDRFKEVKDVRSPRRGSISINERSTHGGALAFHAVDAAVSVSSETAAGPAASAGGAHDTRT